MNEEKFVGLMHRERPKESLGERATKEYLDTHEIKPLTSSTWQPRRPLLCVLHGSVRNSLRGAYPADRIPSIVRMSGPSYLDERDHEEATGMMTTILRNAGDRDDLFPPGTE